MGPDCHASSGLSSVQMTCAIRPVIPHYEIDFFVVFHGQADKKLDRQFPDRQFRSGQEPPLDNLSRFNRVHGF